MPIVHQFVSSVEDGTDDTLVQPSDWNAEHTCSDLTLTQVEMGIGGPTITTGDADPEGAVTAPAGSLYLRSTGSIYAKASGTGNTGWLALLSADA